MVCTTTSPPVTQDPTEATPDSEEMEDEHTPPAQRQGFGLGYCCRIRVDYILSAASSC